MTCSPVCAVLATGWVGPMARASSAFAQVALLAMALVAVMALAALYLGTWYYGLMEGWFPGTGTTAADWTWIDRGLVALMLVTGIPLAVGLSWALARRMSAPMAEVARAIRAVARGDLSARAAPLDLAEMQGLAQDFNRLAERLERSDAEMRFANAAIAHELRTPLTILKGRLQGVQDGVFEMTPQMVSGLIAQVDGLSRIVEDLRLLTLLEPGRVTLTRQPIELDRLVQETLALVADDLTEAGIERRLDLTPVEVQADPARLRQALLALVTNAMRHAPGQPLAITTGTEGGEAWIRLADRGPGLPPEGLERAFDPFWRAEASRGRDKGGSGLGLAVVRAIALAHGGRVAVTNLPEGGAAFTLHLPRG